MSQKPYTVYLLEKCISLLKFAKYIMIKSLLKYIQKGFEIVLKHDVRLLFFACEFSSELSSNQRCYE